MKVNKLIAVCVVVLVVGMGFLGLGVALGGRVYGLSLGTNGINVTSNADKLPENRIDYYDNVEAETDAFQNIDLDVSYMDLTVEESDHYGIAYHVRKNQTITYEIKDQTLCVKQKQPHLESSIQLFSTGNSSFNTTKEYLTIFVPKGSTFGNMKLADESGNVDICSLCADDFLLSSNYGTVTLKELQCNAMELKVESGNIEAQKLSGNDLTISSDYGTVKLEEAALNGKFRCDAESGNLEFGSIQSDEARIRANYGQMTCDDMKVRSLTGRFESGTCDVKSYDGDEVSIDSSYASVNMGLLTDIKEYDCDVNAEYGSVDVNGDNVGESYRSGNGSGSRKIKIQCESGSVTLQNE